MLRPRRVQRRRPPAAGVTRGTAGAISGDRPRPTFDGTRPAGATHPAVDRGPEHLHRRGLVQDTTTTGGKIIGFGNTQHRQLGQLRPARLHGQRRPASSSASTPTAVATVNSSRRPTTTVSGTRSSPRSAPTAWSSTSTASVVGQRTDVTDGQDYAGLLAGRRRQPRRLAEPADAATTSPAPSTRSRSTRRC